MLCWLRWVTILLVYSELPISRSLLDWTAYWSFAYSNSNFVGAGSYGGVNVNNGRVTYTAALP